MTSAIRATLGGVAVVVCVHDREKRQVRDEVMIAKLGREVGVVYDPVQHKTFECACCENLFVGYDDAPRYCHACRGPLAHTLAAPLPEPTGVIG